MSHFSHSSRRFQAKFVVFAAILGLLSLPLSNSVVNAAPRWRPNLRNMSRMQRRLNQKMYRAQRAAKINMKKLSGVFKTKAPTVPNAHTTATPTTPAVTEKPQGSQVLAVLGSGAAKLVTFAVFGILLGSQAHDISPDTIISGLLMLTGAVSVDLGLNKALNQGFKDGARKAWGVVRNGYGTLLGGGGTGPSPGLNSVNRGAAVTGSPSALAR